MMNIPPFIISVLTWIWVPAIFKGFDGINKGLGRIDPYGYEHMLIINHAKIVVKGFVRQNRCLRIA